MNAASILNFLIKKKVIKTNKKEIQNIENNSKINFNVLSVVGLVILVFLYYRTRIDNITKIWFYSIM